MKSMIHKISICICLLFMVQKYNSQIETDVKDFRIGMKGGLNRSVVNATDDVGEKSGYIGTELYGGFVVQKRLTSRSFIQASALISYTDDVTFIELPIYYRYNIYNKISVFGGLKLQYIPDVQYNNFNYFRKRLGINADLGADYQIIKNLYFEASFSKAFTKQYDNIALDYYYSKRNVYRIGFTYYIN